GLQNVVKELAAITGVTYGIEGWMTAGERIYNVEKIFNLRAGFTAKDDTLPQRLLHEPMEEGPSKGHVCKLSEMLPEYYELRGWDNEGRPSEAKLMELGLLELAKTAQ
ncbi:MAG: aldehyde ferredoxin oxidoreductase, partial [Deltaproteobacteria bacterium]